jgi:hypothetical protein
MKTKWVTMLAFALIVLGVFAGCKKKEPDDPIVPPVTNTDNVTKYFSVTGGTNINSALPVVSGTITNKPVVDSIIGNNSVIAGSGNNLRIYYTDPQNDAAQVIVGVKNVAGYYTLPATGSSQNVDVLVIINEAITTQNFTVMIAIKDAAGNISDYYEVSVHLVTSVSNGALEVTLSWDRENDLDLHLVEPNGEEIYYGNTTSANGGELDKDSNAGCYIDSLKVEHITYPTGATLEAGTYTARVDFWSGCNVPTVTGYTVTAKLNGNLVAAATGANPAVGSFDAGTSDGGGMGSGTTVMTFNVTGTTGGKLLIWRFKPLNYVNTK